MFNSTRSLIDGLSLRMFRMAFILALSTLSAQLVRAQIPVTVTGATNTTPNLSATYTSFAAAVADLQNVTAMSGPVTFTLAAGTSETAPVKGFAIRTATPGLFSATNTLTIIKAPGGPTVINAGVGTSNGPTASPDGMLYLDGADYVTIDGLTFTDGNSSSATVAMEFGIAFFKRSAGDGCNNNIIQNCIFNMQRVNNVAGSGPMADGSCAIQVLNSTAAAATTALTPTNGGTLPTNGTNSNNRFYSNQFNNGNGAIHLGGFAATVGVGPSPNPATFLGDINNDIGGSSASTGNTILNFGGAASAANPAAGIRANNQWGLNIRFNTIDNNNGSGVNHPNTLRGIFAQAGTSANATISNNTVTIRGGGTTQQVTAIECGIGATPASNTVSISNNTIVGTYTTATTGVFYAISVTSAPTTLNITSNTVSSMSYSSAALTGTGNVIPIFTNSSNASSTFNVNNNSIQNISRTGTTGGTTIGIHVSAGTTGMVVNVNNNTINNMDIAGSGTSSIMYGVQVPTGTVSVNGNTITNLSCTKTTGTGAMYGIYSFSSPVDENYNNNIINNLTNNGTGATFGIYAWTTTGVRSISGNTIHTITAAGTPVGGIRSNISTPTISKNRIYNIQSNNTAPMVSGIWLEGISSGTALISNNLVGDLKAPTANTTEAIRGINITSTSTANLSVFHNTVYLNATSSGTNFGTTGIFHTASATATSTPLNLRNNIIYNVSTPNGTGLTVAYRRSSGTAGQLANYASTSNNNMFYAGTPGPSRLIYSDGTSSAQTINDYRTGVFTAGTIAPRDAASVSEAISFVSLTGSSPDFLKYPTGTPLQVEQGGGLGTGITDDFAGTTRCPGGGCPGGASTPDIGAWELNGTPSDVTPPTISYTPLPNTACAGAVTLTATITDASGVNGTTGTRPRLYYKKLSDANTFAGNTSGDNGWKFVEATGATSPFTFNLNPALLQSPIVAGDIIQYFVVAQDLASIPNVGINSGVFNATPASVNLTLAAFPITGTINSYTVLNTLPTTINLPADYSTITGAGGFFAALNAAGLSGNTVVNINANLTSETGAVALNQIAYGCGGPFTLTIKPTGGARTVSGASAGQGLIRLNGADNVIIDGSTNFGTDRSLTINNTSTTANSAAVQLISLGAGQGAENDVVKNCNLTTGSIAVTTYGIAVGGATPGSNGADNDNITLDNNNITNVAVGIFAFGTANTSAGGIDNLVVSGNNINTGISTVAAFGIRVGNAQNASITLNTVDVRQSATGAPVGISAETGFLNSSITRNQIVRSFYTGTGGYGGRGIVIGTGSATSNVTIANNFVAGVNGDNWSSFGASSSFGIGIGVDGNTSTLTVTTGGVNLYYNSVHMAGTYSRATTLVITAALYVGSNASNLNVRNNIFSNSLQNTNTSAGACSNYGIYSAAAASAFTVLNYNNYFGNSTTNNTFYVGFLGSNQTTLANWQAAVSPREANGVNLDPQFISATDLHILPSSTNMNNIGTPITGVTIDIDGDTRNATTPDIGADEYTPCTPPSVSINPSSANYCNPNGTPVALTCVGSGTRQWYNGTIGNYTGLFIDAAATIAYTGSDIATVYVKPTVTTTFSVRLTSGSCFNDASSTVTPIPGISLAPNNNGPACPGVPVTLNANASVSNPSNASNYSFSAASGTFTPLTGATNVSAIQADEAISTAVPIGFTFNYLGTNYTNVYASSNGFISFNPSATASLTNNLTSPAATILPLIAPLWDDLSGSGGTASYNTVGAPGNRVFTFEWLNWRWNYSASTAVISFQVKLFEADNHIEFIYRQEPTAVSSGSASIGIAGPAAGSFLSLNGTGPAPTASSSSETTTLNTKPANGQTYAFFPPPPVTLTYAWSAVSFPAQNTDFSSTNTATTTVLPANGVGLYPYQVLVTNTNNGCTALGTTTVTVQTTPLVVNPPLTNNNNFCVGQSATITMTNRFSGGCGPYTYTLHASPGGVVTTGTVSSPAIPNTFVVTPTTTTVYTLQIVDDNGSDITSGPLTINVNNPAPLSASAATRCGVGTTQLTGTVNTGDILAWYTAPTGGTLIGTGSPVTSPVISSTTTFYAAAITSGGVETFGRATPTDATGFITTPNWGLLFNANVPTILQSAVIYPNGSGTVTVAVLNSSNVEIASTGAISVNGDPTMTTPVTISLGLSVPAGTGYRLVLKAYTGITNLRRDLSGNTFPYASANFSVTNGWTGSSTSTAYYWFYNIQALSGCEGTRVPVVATVTPPPAITITGNQVICNNAVGTLTVTSGAGSYDTFVWSPTTNLYTDPAGTIPYTGGSTTTVYVRGTTPGTTTYSLTASQTSGPLCVNVVTTNVHIQPNATSVSPSILNICVSGSTTLSLNPASGYASGTIQWQTGATIPSLADIPGANNPTYTTPLITSGPAFYRVIVRNSALATCAQFTIPVTVNNPQVLSTTSATRCGTGTVNLAATVNSGSSIAWYNSPTGGSAVGTGSPFSPTVSSTTTYYVAAVGSPVSYFLGLPDNSATYGTYNATTASDWPIRFTTTKAVTIKSAVVYPTVAGNLFVALRASGTSSPDLAVVGPITLQASDIGNPVTINLNISVPTPGDYQLTGLSTGPGRIGRMSTLIGNPYPFDAPDGSVSVYGSATLSTSATANTTTYNSFFNIEFESACESPRTAVTATVTPAPAINITASPSVICAGDQSILNVTSSNSGYTYTWLPMNSTGPNQLVSPTSTTVYTVNAQDNSGGPNNGCFNSGQITLNVNPVPTAATVTVSPLAAVCGGTVKTLTATANTNATLNFGTQANVNIASTGAAGYPGPYTVYYGGQRMQMLIRATELSSAGFVNGSQLNSIGFTVVSIGSNNPSNQFFQINMGHTTLSALAANGFQTGLTNVVPVGTYTATIGLNTHNFTTPFVWNGVDNIIVEVTFSNNILGTSADLISSYYSPTSYVSTIVYRADNQTASAVASATNTTFTYTARPDFVLTGNLGATTITWNPVANLFTDLAATNAYVANTNLGTVYAKFDNTATVNARVTLTATGCKTDLPVTLNYTPRPTASISSNDFVCEGQSAPLNVFFTGTGPWNFSYSINGGPPINESNVTSSPFVITYSNATVTRTYAITALSDANCTALPVDMGSRTINVPIPCSITWNGSQAGGDWNNANNWTPNNSAPSQFTSVVIPGNVPNQPVVNAPGVCANMFLTSNPAITVAAGQTLSIRGNITGSTVHPVSGAGKVSLAGTGLQTISTNISFSNLEIANTSAQGVVIAPTGSVRIWPTAPTGSGVLTLLNNARINTNNKLILGSNANGTAKLAPVPTDGAGNPTVFFTGELMQERFIPNFSSRWEFLASPVSGKNFTDWVDDFRIAGPTSSGSGLNYGSQGSGILAMENPIHGTIFKYNEPTHNERLDTAQKIGWRFPGNTEQIVPGKGYRVFISTTGSSFSTRTFDNIGIPTMGTFNWTGATALTRNELSGCIPAAFPCNEPFWRGWNLIGNPYPCDIDWDATSGPALTDGWNKPATMQNAAYRWHSAQNGYGVYQTGLGWAGTSPAPANPNLIPASQGFFVLLSVGGTYNANLTVRESAKVVNASGTFLRTATNNDPKVRLQLSRPGQASIYSYTGVVRTKPDANDGIDPMYDLYNLASFNFHFGFPVEDAEMVVNTLAPITGMKVVPIRTNFLGNTGQFEFAMTEQEGFDAYDIYLRDNLTGIIYDLKSNPSVVFEVDASNLNYEYRFDLIFSEGVITRINAPVSGLTLKAFPNPAKADGQIVVALGGFKAANAKLEVVDMMGRMVGTDMVTLEEKGLTTHTLNMNLPAGVYTIKATAGNESKSLKLVVK